MQVYLPRSTLHDRQPHTECTLFLLTIERVPLQAPFDPKASRKLFHLIWFARDAEICNAPLSRHQAAPNKTVWAIKIKRAVSMRSGGCAVPPQRCIPINAYFIQAGSEVQRNAGLSLQPFGRLNRQGN
eukprot:scaffold242302_cov22-Tisochrysis_lutea.AAC.1